MTTIYISFQIVLKCDLLCCQAGYNYDEETFEKVFRRIYASFGSSAPYTIFPDSQPFLRWVREQGLQVGLVSNAEYRYQDVILPALGLNQVNKFISRFLILIIFLHTRVQQYIDRCRCGVTSPDRQRISNRCSYFHITCVDMQKISTLTVPIYSLMKHIACLFALIKN